MPKKSIIVDSCGRSYTVKDLVEIGKRTRSVIHRLIKRIATGEFTPDELIAKLKKNKKFVKTDLSKLVFIGKKNQETGLKAAYTVKSIMQDASVCKETALKRIKKALKDPSYESELLNTPPIGEDAIDRRPAKLTEEQWVIWREFEKVNESCRDNFDRYYDPIDFSKVRRVTMSTKRA